MLWDVIDKDTYKLYINKKMNSLELKVYDKNKYSEIYLNYKGYNIIDPMEVWEFFTYREEWNIEAHMHGYSLKNASQMYYTVGKKDERAFIDLIYFFISENQSDTMLKAKYKIENW